VSLLQQLGLDIESVLGESLLEAFQDDWVKTFERVPGATVEGSGAEPGQEVEATVELEKPSGQTFEYTQYAEADENGTSSSRSRTRRRATTSSAPRRVHEHERPRDG